MIASGVVTFYLESIRQAWEFVLESGAGIGLVLILRWYWWRVNAWSEISAMLGAAVGFAAVRTFTDLQFPDSLLIVVAGTTVTWIAVTMATPPEPEAHLVAFYTRVRPDGPGWNPIARLAGGAPPGRIGGLLVDWFAGCVLVYSTLFGLGSMLFGRYTQGAAWLIAAAAAIAIIYRDLSRRGWETITG
jgi:hypothetical protein